MDLKELSQQIKTCTNCNLCHTRKNVVVGRGSMSPDVIFIGEGPGEQEDEQGRPFVGKSGMLLDRAIKENNIKNYSIINVVKCRPPQNRKPSPEEIKACSPWLEQQIELLNPKLIVLLGATSLNYFFPEKTITKTVAETALVGETIIKDGRRFVAIFHPSYCLRGAISVDEYIKSFGRINFFLENGPMDAEGEANVIGIQSNAVKQNTDTVGQTTTSVVQSQKYVPLHVHWEHGSVADVFGTDTERAEDFAKKGFTAAAITDHGSLSSLYYAQKALKSKNIKPILGIEAYVREGDREQSHIILLVKNEIGYKNLLKLHTIAKQPENVHKVFNKVFQKIPLKELYKHSEGLICSTACISGAVAKRWRKGKDATSLIQKLHEVFKDDFYLELMPNRIPDQVAFNEFLVDVAEERHIKMIITTDSHYNNPEDKKYHDMIKAIERRVVIDPKIGLIKRRDEGKSYIGDLSLAGFSDDTFSNLRTEQIEDLLKEYHPQVYPLREELFANTVEIANKCNFELPENLGDTLIGDEQEARKKILDRIDIENYKKTSGHDPKVIDERVEKELKLIFNRGFAKYFDKVLDMCDFADSKGIPRGPGRGSVGGSLVAYLLGITRVDPLRFNTLWERFLTPTRTPDIDMDFSGLKRASIIGHLKAKYGKTNVAYIITFNEWSDKSALRDVGRIYGVSLEEINKFTKELSTKTAENLKIEDILLTSDTALKFQQKYPDVIDGAIKLKGKIRHTGMHAAGVIICQDLENSIPTELYDRQDAKNSLVSSWEKDSLESLGIIKFDVLGLSILDIIDECIKSVGINWKDLPEDYADERVFEMLRSGKTAGVFQFGSQLITDYLRHLNSDKFEDLVAANALCRPGPLNSGLAADYVDRKAGKKEWDYDHPRLEPITQNTYGIVTYQEQIMEIAHQIGNFSMVDSEKFLKLVSKSKGKEAIKEKYDQMLNGAISNDFTKQQFDNLFDKLIEFGRYSFNMSHSLEYSIIGYWTAWLKLYYPLAFYTALVNSEEDEDQSLKYVKEAMDGGIELKPPSIEYPSATAKFDQESNTIFLGLNKVKGIGPEEIKKIIEAGTDFEKLRKIKKNLFQSLVEIGYTDHIQKNRKQLLTSKELTKNTLWAWADNTNPEVDWSEEEKLARMRKNLTCWPRSANELPKLAPEYETYRKPLSYLKGESVDNSAFLSVGWVYDSKVYTNNSGISCVLKYEDGTSRVELNLSNKLYLENKTLVDQIVEEKYKKPLIFCLHPWYMNRGEILTKEGKAQIVWMSELDREIPAHILKGMDRNFENLQKDEFLVTNISYFVSKAGNRLASVECLDGKENLTYGAIMDRKGSILPSYGNTIKGKWNSTDRGCYFRGESTTPP